VIGAACLCATLRVWPAFAADSVQTLLTWPQKVTLQGPVLRTFGIPATQPGPVDVALQVEGAPVVASLNGTAAPLASQQGAGALHMTYTITDRDVQSGPVLVLALALAQPQPQSTSNVTVTVRHPGVDSGRLNAAIQAASSRASSANGQQRVQFKQRAAAVNAQIDADLTRDRAGLQQAQAQQRAALMAQVQSQIVQLRNQSQVQTRALPARGPVVRTPLNPAIKSLTVNNATVTQLHVGDPIFVNGSGFGAARGTLHFVIGAGQDLTADPAAGLIWSDSQIFAVVPGPAAGGLPAFSGVAYLTNAAGVQSNLQPFAFVPQLDYRTIAINAPISDAVFFRIPGDRLEEWSDPWDGIVRQNGNCFSGETGSDQILVNTRLKNGWTVRGAPTVLMGFAAGGGGGAVLTSFLMGTNSPAVGVLWWVNVGAFYMSEYGYKLSIPIQGPLGFPDGVAVLARGAP
jgi:hypothetical protein